MSEINGDYFEYENVHYSGGNIKKSYRNKILAFLFFIMNFIVPGGLMMTITQPYIQKI